MFRFSVRNDVGHLVRFSSGQWWSSAEGQDKICATGSNVTQLNIVFFPPVSVHPFSGALQSQGVGTICLPILALQSAPISLFKRCAILKMVPIYCTQQLQPPTFVLFAPILCQFSPPIFRFPRLIQFVYSGGWVPLKAQTLQCPLCVRVCVCVSVFGFSVSKK